MADFQAFLVITVLTLAAVTVSGTTPELSTTTGDTVNIPCLFGEGTLRHIFWYYNGDSGPQKILLLSKGVLAIDPEYADRASLQNNNSTLILREITVADEGTYRCDVDRQGQTVVTNINTNLNVFSLRPDTLPVIPPCTVSDESSSCSIHANQSFTLTATLSNVYPVEDTELIWYQDGQRVSFTNDVNTQNDDGTTDISIQIQVSETGYFTCNATYVSANGRENTARSVEAWIMSLSDVPNTPGKYMTSDVKVWLTISFVMIGLGLSGMLINTLIRYRLQARGQRSSRKETNKSDGTQLSQVTSEEPLILLETSAETGSKNGYGLLPSIENFDDTLVAVAKRVRKDAEIDTLGKKLKFSPADIQGYIQTNYKTQDEPFDGTLQMLRDWRTNRRGSTERGALKTALEQSGKTHLADELFSSVENSTLPKSFTRRNRHTKRPTEETSEQDFDYFLKTLAKRIHMDDDIDIDSLGGVLGFEPTEMQCYIQTNKKTVSYLGTLSMLRDWRNRTTRSEESEKSKKALIAVNYFPLADDLLNDDVAIESSTLLSSSTKKQEGNRIVSEEEFIKLSKLIAPSYYKQVGVNLEIPNAELGQIIMQHFQHTNDALMTVFTRWRDKQPPGTDIRTLLAERLERSGLGSLSGELLAGSLVPTRTDLAPPTENFDDMLVAVAKKLRRASDIDTLGKQLGFSPEDIHGYIATSHQTKNITYDGTLQMLRDWRKGQTNSTELRALKTALEQSGQIRLADDLFSSAPTTSGATGAPPPYRRIDARYLDGTDSG